MAPDRAVDRHLAAAPRSNTFVEGAEGESAGTGSAGGARPRPPRHNFSLNTVDTRHVDSPVAPVPGCHDRGRPAHGCSLQAAAAPWVSRGRVAEFNPVSRTGALADAEHPAASSCASRWPRASRRRCARVRLRPPALIRPSYTDDFMSGRWRRGPTCALVEHMQPSFGARGRVGRADHQGRAGPARTATTGPSRRSWQLHQRREVRGEDGELVPHRPANRPPQGDCEQMSGYGLLGPRSPYSDPPDATGERVIEQTGIRRTGRGRLARPARTTGRRTWRGQQTRPTRRSPRARPRRRRRNPPRNLWREIVGAVQRLVHLPRPHRDAHGNRPRASARPGLHL